MRRLLILAGFAALLAVPAAQRRRLGDGSDGAAASRHRSRRDVDGAAHGAPARRHAHERGDTVDHHSRRERLADVRGDARRCGWRLRRAGGVSVGGQVGLRGERRARCDRLRRVADAHVLARRGRTGNGRRQRGAGLAVRDRSCSGSGARARHRHEAAPAEACPRELRVYKSSGEPATRRIRARAPFAAG